MTYSTLDYTCSELARCRAGHGIPRWTTQAWFLPAEPTGGWEGRQAGSILQTGMLRVKKDGGACPRGAYPDSGGEKPGVETTAKLKG